VEEENFNFNEESNGHVFFDDIFQTINSPNVSLKNNFFFIAAFFPTLPNKVTVTYFSYFLGFDVPKEARTIKGTPRSGPSSESFALKKGMENNLKNCRSLNYLTEIKLNFNTDGIPLYKNLMTDCWPILCMIIDVPCITSPFVVSYFSGIGKPSNLNEFWDPFITELLDLLANGI